GIDLSDKDKLLVGRTNSWDLASLLIKPVQRILKYPLLFQELAFVSIGEDSRAVLRAKERVDLMAERVNNGGKKKAKANTIINSLSHDDSWSEQVDLTINRTLAMVCALEDMFRSITSQEQIAPEFMLNMPQSVFSRERCLRKAANLRQAIEIVRDEVVPLLKESGRLDKFYDVMRQVCSQFLVTGPYHHAARNTITASGDKQAIQAFQAIDQSIEKFKHVHLPLERIRWSTFWTETDKFFVG
ncbi:hypothetical protein EV182_002582, partial [Spiromyces aspiralis]